MKKRRILRSERGFTLVELGIVMAIIAILAAVAYPTYSSMKNRAHIAEAKALLQEARVELFTLYVQDGEWPDTFTIPTTGGWEFTYTTSNEDPDGQGGLLPQEHAKIVCSSSVGTLTLRVLSNGTVIWEES